MLRVLIIEDEPLIALLLQHVLSGMGHVVVGIEGTEAGAVSSAKRLRPTLLLVDARLREGTGRGALHQILAQGFIPHVLISGGQEHDTMSDRPGSARTRKPFTDRDLELAIAQATATAPQVHD